MKVEIENTVTCLPPSLLDPFAEWLLRGGHGIKGKKNRLTISKGDRHGVIHFDDLKMNDYMIERFNLFSQQWLKHGKPFLIDLPVSLFNKHKRAVAHSELAKVA